MEIEKEFENCKLERKQIIYPAYQTTHRFHNLYSDIRTFVRELIQNADDADAEAIKFKINLPKEIEIINNGKSFDSNDIKRLLTPCLGGKEFEKTGAMNLGALSVLSVSDEPLYHSGNTVLKFEMNHESEDFIPYINENHNSYFKGTRLILPFHSRISSDDLKKLDKIEDYLTQYSHLIFTRKLKQIILEYPNKTLELNKNLNEESSFKHKDIKASIINITISENYIKNKNIQAKKVNWLIFKRNLEIPKKYFTKNELTILPENTQIPIYIAFALDNNLPKRIEYPIYIIFPSETQFGLGFALSSNFKPETSRKGFSTEGIDGNFNRFLLRKASELIELSLNYFRREISSLSPNKRNKYFYTLIETLYYRDTYSSLEPYIKDYIYNKIIKFLKKNILDQEGRWVSASQIAIADPGLWPFFKNQFKFIDPDLNEKILILIKAAGVQELTIINLINLITQGSIKRIVDLFNAWTYLSIHSTKLKNQTRDLLLKNKTLPNRIGKLMIPTSLVIPQEEAIGLYYPQQELYPKFVKNKSLRIFISSLGIAQLKKKNVLEYFILRKSSFSSRKLESIKKYYEYFHKYGLLERRRKIVITNNGFKNPKEAFFDNKNIKKILGNKVPIIPKELENSKKCKMYLENLGVSKEIKVKHIMNYIINYGSEIISLDLLKYLSKNIRDLDDRDLKILEEIELIPTTKGQFVRPSECYFLNDMNQKILENLVNYFDPKEKSNKEWLKFFKKIGISKYPKIKHLRLALNESIKNYKNLGKSNVNNKDKIIKRIELILLAIVKNKQKEEKNDFITELINIKFVPTSKGLKKPILTYLKEPNVMELLCDSVPYSLISIPDKLIKKIKINKKPIPEDVANYLLKDLRKDKNFLNQNSKNEDIVKYFDKIYSFLGFAENFNKLNIETIKKLMNKSIIYLPNFHLFEKPSNLTTFSREAEIIYGNKRNLIKYSDYPNSFNFFKKIGIKISINSNDIANYLIEYINQGKIETQRLFMLYNTLGQRFKFLSKTQKLKLRKSKIILNNDLKSFEYPEKIFIPDEKLYVEKFPSIKVAMVNDKIVEFLEKLRVKKISEIIIKNINFSGNILENDFTKSLTMGIIELIPFIDIITKDSHFILDKNWKSRINKVKCLMSDEIFYDLQYKNKKNRIQGKSAEYDSKKNIIGIIKGAYDRNLKKFYVEIAKAISFCLFLKDLPKAKIISPLIEKLFSSENKIQTLKELGFSTFKLETKKYNIPKIKINFAEKMNLNQKELNKNNSINNTILNYDLTVNSKISNTRTISKVPENIKIIEKTYNHEKSQNSIKIIKTQPKIHENNLNITIKTPPSHNKLINLVREQIRNDFDLKYKKVSNYYEIEKHTKEILNKKKKILFQSMEFAGHAEYGGLDITPSIPKLYLKKLNGFHYYIQSNLDYKVEIELLQKFRRMLQFIIKIMGGNPNTVAIGLFNAPIEAFNYNGQLIFNYILMGDKDLKNKYPIFLIWLMISAHELAHNIYPNHNQLHSKQTMIFTLEALKNLKEIKDKFFLLYKKK